MFVLCAIRSDYIEKPGGDTIQFLKTIEYLKKRYDIKIEIVTCSAQIKKLAQKNKIDIIHIFNIQTMLETRDFFNAAAELKIPICFTPIYWNLYTSIFAGKLFNLFGKSYLFPLRVIESIKPIILRIIYYLRHNKFGSKAYVQLGNKLLNDSNVILPNSPEEAEIIKSIFRIHSNNFKSIPNAVDIQNFKICESRERRNGVIQVGRIEVNKNQLIVLRALWSHKEIKITFIGRVSKGIHNQCYYSLLIKMAKIRGNVEFLEEVPNSDLPALYRSATVHVLPSFRESPGLVSLEALASGCNIVVSNEEYCPIHYYEFDKYAYVCNPLSKKSVEAQILKALKNDKLKPDHDYWKKFSYEAVADATYNAYIAMSASD